ncbi:MAG TPA: dTDP-4-dehydrorhamnose reductase [Usitatibacter sp.]|nr:dTDP-4-dehydrorhamnose reductase [Usitatibacter sp.]
MLVTGAGGQVGTDVARVLEGRAEVIAQARDTMDLSDPAQLVARIREAAAQVIVNAAAYTAVDRAESEPEAAHTVNGVAPGLLAREARRAGALMLHFSTDYVFDGAKRTPYVETDATNPLGVYGRSKLEGERAVLDSGAAAIVLRTAWVYAPHGRNFMLTMLRLAAKGEPLRVVDDQHGAPTTSVAIARAVAAILAGGANGGKIDEASVAKAAARSGLYHATAGGETSWFGFAQAIFAERARATPGFVAPKLSAITTAEYPTPAKRPAYSVLDNGRLRQAFGISLGDWREGLAEAISALG